MNLKKYLTWGRVRLLLVLLLIIGCVITTLVTSLDNVDVYGSGYYSEDEIRNKVLTHFTDKNTLLFMARYKLFGLEEIPLVEKISVEWVDKNSISIQVYDKKIAGCALIMGQYVCFDRLGVVSDCTDVRPIDAPLIRGVEFIDFRIGSKLSTPDETVYQKIMSLTSLLEKNGIYAQEIFFDFRDEVTLKIDDDEVLLGKKDNYDLQINNLRSIMNSVGEGSFRFDLRYMNEHNMSVTAKEISGIE